MNFRLPKIERLDRLWELFDRFFKDLKCDLFYQKEKKIQIFLKNENYSRKRHASSDSDTSEVTPSPDPGRRVATQPLPLKLKLKKPKRDPQTSSVKSDKSEVTKLEVNTSSGARLSPSTSVVTRPLTPVVSPQLSPTKSGGKKVPIYHNAHKIFRAQQIARQIMGSRETEAVTSPSSPALVTVSTISSKFFSHSTKCLNLLSYMHAQYFALINLNLKFIVSNFRKSFYLISTRCLNLEPASIG